MSQKCALADLEQFLPEEKRIKRRIWTNLSQVKEDAMPEFLEFLEANGVALEPAVRNAAKKAYTLKGPDGIIGGSLLCEKAGVFYLAALTVREADRRKKYGEILLNKMMKVLREMEAASALVLTEVPEFYHRFAFFPAGERDANVLKETFGSQKKSNEAGVVLMKYEW